ncbi:MAG: hypothetical protein ACEQSB_00620 [Undibacterium sp.]
MLKWRDEKEINCLKSRFETEAEFSGLSSEIIRSICEVFDQAAHNELANYQSEVNENYVR